MTISPIYNSQLYILRYTTKAKVKNEPFCQTRKINIRIKFYLFCRTHAFEHHRYIVEFYITKLSIQCSLPMCSSSSARSSSSITRSSSSSARGSCRSSRSSSSSARGSSSSARGSSSSARGSSKQLQQQP